MADNFKLFDGSLGREESPGATRAGEYLTLPLVLPAKLDVLSWNARDIFRLCKELGMPTLRPSLAITLLLSTALVLISLQPPHRSTSLHPTTMRVTMTKKNM